MLRSSLRRELLIPFILLIIGVSTAIGWVSVKAGSEAVMTLTQRILTDMVNRIGNATEKHLDGALIALESVAPSPAYLPREQIFSDAMPSLEEKFWAASGLFMSVNNYVYYGGRDGRFVGVYRISNNTVQLFWRNPDEDVRHVYQVNSIGDRSLLLRSDQFDPRQRPWYQAAMNSDKPVWSKIYNNYSFQYPTVTLAKAVYKDNHEFIGVVATDLTLKEISNFLRRLEISKNGVAYIVDADGYVIATSGQELPEQLINGKPQRLRAVDMKTPLISGTYRKILNQGNLNANILSVDLAGESIDVVASPLGNKQGLQWTTVVAIPRSEYMSTVHQSFMQSLVIAIACVIFALTIGLTVVQRVVGDIRKLTNAVASFGNGEPIQELHIHRNDEIGTLADTFVEMENRLRFDKLTQVANREALFTQIDYLQKNAKQNEQSQAGFCLLFVDLDRFKFINDHYGHDAGDKVLIIIAARLRAAIRETDLVARYGGDEFVLLIKDTPSAADIENLVEKICQVVEQPILSDTLVLQVGASIGWASCPEDGKDYMRLLKIADSRMYNRKRDRKAATIVQIA